MIDDLPPISAFFFDDPGPHLVRAGFSTAAARPGYTPARGQELHALINTSIAQLGAVSGEGRRKTPPPLPPPVPIETLIYKGRAALDRALEVRQEFIASGGQPDTELVGEVLDLIALASTE